MGNLEILTSDNELKVKLEDNKVVLLPNQELKINNLIINTADYTPEERTFIPQVPINQSRYELLSETLKYGLMDAWMFNETDVSSGKTTSLNGREGSLGVNTIYEPGKFGNSVRTDGTKDGMVLINDSGINTNKKEEFSLAFWFKLNSFNNEDLSNTYTILDMDFFHFMLNDKKLPDKNWKPGEWHHVVFSVDNSIINIYFDGKKYISSRGLFESSNNYISIGANINGNNQTDCNVDDILIWERGLSDEEIIHLYNLGNEFHLRFSESGNAFNENKKLGFYLINALDISYNPNVLNSGYDFFMKNSNDWFISKIILDQKRIYDYPIEHKILENSKMIQFFNRKYQATQNMNHFSNQLKEKIIPVSGENPMRLAFDGRHIWSVNKQSVSKIDVNKNLEVANIKLEGGLLDIIFDGQHIWVNRTHIIPSFLAKIDVNTNEIIHEIEFDEPIFFMATDGKTLWVTNGFTPQISKIDISTNERMGEIQLPSEVNICKISFDGEFLWIIAGDKLFKVNRHEEIIYGWLPNEVIHDILFDGTYLWASTTDFVARIDVKTNEVIKDLSIKKYGSTFGMVFDGSYLWVSHPNTNSVSKIDVNSRTIVSNEKVGKNPFGLVFDGSYIWTANQGSNDLSKILTLDHPSNKTNLYSTIIQDGDDLAARIDALNNENKNSIFIKNGTYEIDSVQLDFATKNVIHFEGESKDAVVIKINGNYQSITNVINLHSDGIYKNFTIKNEGISDCENLVCLMSNSLGNNTFCEDVNVIDDQSNKRFYLGFSGIKGGLEHCYIINANNSGFYDCKKLINCKSSLNVDGFYYCQVLYGCEAAGCQIGFRNCEQVHSSVAENSETFDFSNCKQVNSSNAKTTDKWFTSCFAGKTTQAINNAAGDLAGFNHAE